VTNADVHAADVHAAVVAELQAHGHTVPESGYDTGLFSLGVNSADLIQVMSVLEDAFGIDLDLERLFASPVTVARLVAEVVRAGGLPAGSDPQPAPQPAEPRP
jgi:acyl carrier protein